MCGAIPPYNHIIGGKLVALSAFSKELQTEYTKRYKNAQSEIASAMAGRSIVKPTSLEIVTTTSLYGKSSQYNRLKVRANQFQELPYNLFWEELGFTEGQGTFHFSNNTSLKLNRFFTERLGYRHINNVWEGTGAKMRKLRSAINLLGINEEKLIEHSQKRNFLASN